MMIIICILYHSLGNLSSEQGEFSVWMYRVGFVKEVGHSVVLYVSPLFDSAGCITYGFGASIGRVNIYLKPWGDYLWPPGKCQGEVSWALRI